MFFIASKIVWAILTPASLGIILLVLGLTLRRLSEQVGHVLLICAAAVLIIFGISPAGPDLLHHLEISYAKPSPMPDSVDGVIILGGAIETRASGFSGMPEVNDGADRIIAGLTLARRYPQATIVFSGGDGSLLRHDNPRESDTIAALIANIGLEDENIVFEHASRNTFENLKNTYDMVKPAPGQVWLLVTSAYHMRRSMGIAQELGWNLTPYPVDYRGLGHYVLWPERYDVTGTLFMSDLALREWAGILAYRLTGKL